MLVYISIVTILLLFTALGFSANIVVNNIKKIAHTLGVPVFLLGMILGILTSFPEFSIAINASINNMQEISVGNLFGGIFVLFGLILGLSLVLNRKIKTDGKIMTPLPGFALLLLPLVCGLDGEIGLFDGIIICLGYLAILVHLHNAHKHSHGIKITVTKKKLVVEELVLVIGGSLGIVIASSFIIQITTALLNEFAISGFAVGLLAFSIGTNLPELTIIITSWRKKMTDLSFSHLLGSAIVNALILGIMGLFHPVHITLDFSYQIIFYFMILMSIMILYFYKSNRSLSRPEGVVLLLLFALFGYLQCAIQ